MRVRASAATLLAALAFSFACAHPTRSAYRPDRPTADEERPPAPAPVPVPEPAPPQAEPEDEGVGPQEGMASFYAHRFHGRKTASGTRYDMHAMTCAHPTAPFGTRLRVTDVETGRSVVVVVNDRGPYARGRVIDLSLAAARKLGIVKRGVARVRIEPLE